MNYIQDSLLDPYDEDGPKDRLYLKWLRRFIEIYYEKRQLVWPSFKDAMEWVQTELAEVYELDLARSAEWIRNNPSKHPPYSKEKMAEELGDAIFMLIVASIVEGVDPFVTMLDKMESKL